MSRKGRGNRKNRRSSTNRINTSGKKKCRNDTADRSESQETIRMKKTGIKPTVVECTANKHTCSNKIQLLLVNNKEKFYSDIKYTILAFAALLFQFILVLFLPYTLLKWVFVIVLSLSSIFFISMMIISLCLTKKIESVKPQLFIMAITCLHYVYAFSSLIALIIFQLTAHLNQLGFAILLFLLMFITEAIAMGLIYLDKSVGKEKTTARWFIRTWPYPLIGLAYMIYRIVVVCRGWSPAAGSASQWAEGAIYTFLVVTYMKQVFDERICPLAQPFKVSVSERTD